MKQYTVKEAAEIVKANKDAQAIAEIGQQNPFFLLAAAKNDAVQMAQLMPDEFTLDKLSSKGAVKAVKTEKTEAKPEAAEEGGDSEVSEYEGLTKQQLLDECLKRGLKVSKYQKPKSYYIAALTKDDGEGSSEELAEEADDEATENSKADADEEEASKDYSKMGAVDLFKECKKRGIKAATRKPAKFYIELLEKDDAAKAEPEEDADDDDWDADESSDEAEEPKKASKAKSAPKAEKKAAPAKASEDEDDDDDWDI